MGALFGRGLQAVALTLALAVAVLPSSAQQSGQPPASGDATPPKIPDKLPLTDQPTGAAPVEPTPTSPPPASGATGQPPATAPAETAPPVQDGTATDDIPAEDDTSLGEIPEIKSVELTPQTAKSAIDTYLLLKDKYKDARLEDYETLQEFVDKDPQGKLFEADVKAAGFADVEVWNQTITTVSTTHANLLNDQSEEYRKQIDEIEKDNELAQDMKDRLINSLKALISSANNKTVVADLQKDSAYAEKLKQLEDEEE